MNERIQALADEAEDYADGISDQGGEFHPAYTEKLAELIIQRTLEIVEAHTEIFQSDEARAMVEHIKSSVQKDFG